MKGWAVKWFKNEMPKNTRTNLVIKIRLNGIFFPF